MGAPDVDTVKEYLGSTDWTDEEIESAFGSEKAAQAKVCIVPTPTDLVPDPDWDPDLVEALCRRVAHNLELRRLPLGLKTSLSETTVASTRVGGTDAEVLRLEAPFKPVVFG